MCIESQPDRSLQSVPIYRLAFHHRRSSPNEWASPKRLPAGPDRVFVAWLWQHASVPVNILAALNRMFINPLPAAGPARGNVRRHLSRIACLVPALALALVLTSCSAFPRHYAGVSAEYGPQRERQIFYALTLVKADDAQRGAILASFDDTDPKLKSLAEEAARLEKQLRSLGPEQATYPDSVSPLARRGGEIVTEKISVQAQFLHVVATTLRPDQWLDWEKFFRSFEDRPAATDDGENDGRFSEGRRGHGGQ